MTPPITDILFFTPFGLLIGVILLEIAGGSQQSREIARGIVLLWVVTSLIAFTNFVIAAEGAGIWPLLLALLSGMSAAFKHHFQTRLKSAARKPVRKRGHTRHSNWQATAGTAFYYTLLISSAGVLAAPLMFTTTPRVAPTVASSQRSLLEDHVEDDEYTATSESPVSRMDDSRMALEVEEPAESNEVATVVQTPAEGDASGVKEEPELEEKDLPSRDVVSRSPQPQHSAKSSPFHTFIVPIFRKHCVSCHGSDQQKGDLRLDSPEAIRKGGKSGAVVIAGQPNRSNLYTSVILPDGDPDLMPAKGDRLSAQDADLIMKWIRAGADMGEGMVATNTGSSFESKVLGIVDEATAQALESSYILARARGQDALELDCSQVRNYGVPVNWELITRLGPKVVSLDLARCDLLDDDLQPISSLPNLTHLDLSNTPVGDAAMIHVKDLAHLEIINLYGTKVGDEGLKSLHNLKNLKKIYLWQSKVTPTGVEQLKRAIPEIEANLGT